MEKTKSEWSKYFLLCTILLQRTAQSSWWNLPCRKKKTKKSFFFFLWIIIRRGRKHGRIKKNEKKNTFPFFLLFFFGGKVHSHLMKFLPRLSCATRLGFPNICKGSSRQELYRNVFFSIWILCWAFRTSCFNWERGDFG
jgi:hypothetical protein